MTDRPWKAPAIFVVVLVAVVGVAALAGVVTSDTAEYDHETPSVADVENEQYDLDRFDIDGTPGQASVSMDSDATNATVVVDIGRGVPPRQIQPLVNTLTENGHEVKIRGGGPTAAMGSVIPMAGVTQSVMSPQRDERPPLGKYLEESHAYVSVGMTRYNPDDTEALAEFAADDGRVLVLTEPEESFTGDHAMFGVQSQLGVYAEPGYVYNLEENDLNYQRVFTEPTTSTNLTADVSRAVFETAQPVETDDGIGQLDVIEGTQLSTSRAPVNASVLARDDNVAIAGDMDFISPENAQRADNDELIGNLADFLVTGDRNLTADEPSGNETTVKTITVGPDGDPVFEPRALEIENGTTVRFEWASDGYAINVTSQPDGANWEGVPEPKEAGSVHVHTFEVEGIYRFESPGHAEDGMIGGIAVGNPEELQ